MQLRRKLPNKKVNFKGLYFFFFIMIYTIKEQFSDFQVNEVLDDSIVSSNSTQYHLYILKKQNYTTERAVFHVSRGLNIPRKFISYAGTKDKQAITTQYITIKGVSREKIDSLKLKDIELSFAGFANKQLSLGDLKGNDFVIIVRNIKSKPLDFPEQFYVPNYFDEQRFSNKNFEIGLSILKNDYKQVIQILIEFDRDHKELIGKHLERQTNDFVGALKILPRKTLLFFVHSVQSKFFNELLAEKIKASEEVFKDDYSKGTFLFPKHAKTQEDTSELVLVGWDSQKYNYLLANYGITSRDFLVRSIPELTLEETKRKSYIKVSNFSIQYEKDTAIVKFRLGKGSYATIVLRQIFAS
jgi:tRNA pseudouridine13 synthase